jgi:hypothetical protein
MELYVHWGLGPMMDKIGGDAQNFWRGGGGVQLGKDIANVATHLDKVNPVNNWAEGVGQNIGESFQKGNWITDAIANLLEHYLIR